MNHATLYILFITSLTICNGFPSNNNLDVKHNRGEECNLSEDIINDIAEYEDKVNIIMDYFVNGPFKGQTWKRLSDFIDKFGPRLAGSINLENSIDYMINSSIQNNLENVHAEDCEVPYWIRGTESATLLLPRMKNLPMLGLGYSVATPSPNGITAEAVVVQSFDELEALPLESVVNKIVIYDQPFESYGESYPYRSNGASEASKKGAVAALVKSITPFSIATPHAGLQLYLENVTHIPVAAITPEDADMLWRVQQRGEKIVIHLEMSAKIETKTSRNTVADLTGYSDPEKIVIVSGHLDSWDIGDGAMDDAGGCFISWMAPIALKELNMRPRRTLRTILFTAEELGIIGAEAYEAQHKEDNDNIKFVMESDIGTFAPLGLSYEGSKDGECMMREILKLFTSINATELIVEEPGPDISVWTSQGIPGAGFHNDNPRYFWFHHSQGDTMNVLDSDVLDVGAGFWTAVSYIVADMKYDIPRDE